MATSRSTRLPPGRRLPGQFSLGWVEVCVCVGVGGVGSLLAGTNWLGLTLGEIDAAQSGPRELTFVLIRGTKYRLCDESLPPPPFPHPPLCPRLPPGSKKGEGGASRDG